MRVDHLSGDPAQTFLIVFRANEPVETFGTDVEPFLVLNPGESFTGTVTVEDAPSQTANPPVRRARRR